jgi:hypothetical protein
MRRRAVLLTLSVLTFATAADAADDSEAIIKRVSANQPQTV